MALTITVVPFQLSPTETVTNSKLNQGFSPSINFSGSVGTGDLSSGAVTAAKFTPDAYAYVAASGTDTYTGTFSPSFTSLINGLQVWVKFANANTATTPTFNPNGLGAKKIRFRGDIALRAGDLPANCLVSMVYNTSLDAGSGGWELQDTLENYTAVVASARNLQITNNATNPTYQADITADEVVLKNTAGVPLLVSTVSNTVDISLGVALNGLETGATETASTWYYVWLISDGTNVRSVLETAGAGDGAAPGGPDLSGGAFTGYTYKALVGVVRNSSGSDFLRFQQMDREVFLHHTQVFTAKTGVTSWTALTGGDLTGTDASFRSLVAPNAMVCAGNCGSSTTAGIMAVSACGATGAVDATNLIGAVVAGADTAGATIIGFVAGSLFRIPVRGGAATRNMQWIAGDTDNQYRLTINGFTL